MGRELCDLYKKAGVRLRGVYYPTFSYKQQIELLEVLLHGRWIEMAQHYPKRYYMGRVDYKRHCEAETLEEVIAGLMCSMWRDFSDKEREEIIKILEVED